MMGTNTLTDRTDGQVISQSFFNDIHTALNGVLVSRNASGVPTDINSDLGSTTYRWKDAYIQRFFLGAIASGISFEDVGGDLVLKRNSLEVGRFTVNGMDASDLVDASVTLSKMANNSVDTNQLVAAAVTLAKMDSNSVGTSQLVNLAVTTDKINSLAVTEARIGTGAVTTAKIGENAVSPVKLFDQTSGTFARASAAVSGTAVNNATTTVASVSFTPATTERLIRINLNSSSTTNSSIAFTSTGTIGSNILFRRAATTIASQRVVNATASLTLPCGSFSFDYVAPDTTTQTFDVQFACDSANTIQALGSISFNVYHP